VFLEVLLEVVGMTCSACENTVRSALLHLAPTEGQPTCVQRVPDVNFGSGLTTVVVHYYGTAAGGTLSFNGGALASLAGSDRLVAALDAVGFDARVLSVTRITAESGLDDASGISQCTKLESIADQDARYVQATHSL
jgi:copper chaperone CopZ